jgi:hypothetical protein
MRKGVKQKNVLNNQIQYFLYDTLFEKPFGEPFYKCHKGKICLGS